MGNSLVEGLTANAMFNYRRYYENEKQVGKEYTLYIHETSGGHNHIIRDDAPVVGTRTRTENGNFVRKDFNETSAYTLNLQLNYNRTFGKHDIGAMFLYEQYEEWGDMFWAQRKQLLSSSLNSYSPEARTASGKMPMVTNRKLDASVTSAV